MRYWKIGAKVLAVVIALGVVVAAIMHRAFARQAVPLTLGQLSVLRGALEVYKEDQGRFPLALDTLVRPDGKYLMKGSFPRVRMFLDRPHKDGLSSIYYGRQSNDAGGWIYDNEKGSPTFGRVWVNCTHTDHRGSAWGSY